MPIVSRHHDETLLIGEISLTVLDMDGDQVLFGVHAPEEMSVHSEGLSIPAKDDVKVPTFDLTLQALILKNFSLKRRV